MPYTDRECSLAPTAEQLQRAATWPTGQYHRLTTVDDMKSVIASGFNFRVGFTVYPSFENDWAVKGYMPMPTSSEQPIGGHEVLAIAYDDDQSAFLIRNSWGASWGLDGNFWFPYQAVANESIFSDGWTQHLGRWVN
jgi:C1A family cysteine protease